jgi:murein DD-endopeptidase MepM/ murein hydrolase activator NlpD
MLARLLFFCGLFMACTSAVAMTIYKSTDANGVVSYSDRPSKGAQVFVFQDRMVERLERQVYLDIKKQKGTDVVFVRNDLYAPVKIALAFTGLSNVRGAPAQTIHRVLPARSNTRLALLTAVSGKQPLVYTPQFHYSLGDPAGIAQGYRYPLPWRGGPFRLSQGANGQYSHYGPKNRYAMDIAMPVGTPIIAARAGVVVKTENAQSGRGNDASGNFRAGAARRWHDGRVPAPQAGFGERARGATGGGGQSVGAVRQYRQQQWPALALCGAAQYG